jgi:biopolymer transport protein ExbD
MPRVKVARKSTAIDMTAMCDVAFLLLTFFILSAKPKSQDPIHAEVPASTAQLPVDENDVSTILVAQQKAFFGITGADLRTQTLKQMGEKYKITFTPEETKVFVSTESFGVPIQQLKQFLSMSGDDRTALKQPGIPVDTTSNNELYNWVHEARVADKYLHNQEMKLAIKGDSQEEYPTIAKIIKTLQKQKVNKFSLITSLRTVTK